MKDNFFCRGALLYLAVLLLFPGLAEGQGWLAGKWRNLRQMNKMLAGKESNSQLTHLLYKRVVLARNLHYHWQSRHKDDFLFMENQFKHLLPVYSVGEPDAWQELDTRIDNAWVYSNNRYMLAARVRLEHAWSRLRHFMPKMEKELRISFQENMPCIPDSAKYVFLGEAHGLEEIRKLFLNVILTYQKQHPEKQIIVLTEFQHDKGLQFTPFNEEERFKDFKKFFDVLAWHYIPFAGLEEVHSSVDDRQFVGINGYTYPAQRTGEGMRLRNMYWEKRIRAWERKYPQAVFFTYAGNGHVDYQAPFSVSRQFPPGKTFVFSVYKNPQFNHIFHAASQARFVLPGALLTWNNPRWGRIAGFDAAYILPSPTD